MEKCPKCGGNLIENTKLGKVFCDDCGYAKTYQENEQKKSEENQEEKSKKIEKTENSICPSCGATMHYNPTNEKLHCLFFETEKYIGKWYEIARIDNRFEKNLINVTAEYSLNPDGTIKVINKGYNKIKNTEKLIEGKAKIIDKGILKVYFVPFFGGDYNVLYVDNDYQYAVVGGNKKNYLWILSRKDSLEEDIYDKLVEIASERGYDAELLEKF